MDDTHHSRVSDTAATRKRRSSILKSQRPARTPFSELEFNVATPTDTAKSRRVSFSRRTGVAEFVTNEATTTWKNFYEEHNKSLESSGNDSEVNASRQPIEHLGKRIFDDQFEEVEGVDFMSGLNPALGTSTTLNNINFTEQIASLECTSDLKLSAPRNAFELSALTDHQSKLFGNDFTVTGVGELSGRIEVNFSTVEHIGDKDDLDAIERDLKRGSNAISIGPSNRHNLSEYIEVDLNMTHMEKNDDCDMSITDTVHSPKVQDVSKNCSIDKKASIDKDWVVDKENIAVNPYAAPRETDNFAVNDEPNQVLVFDGKRLTLQTETADKDYRKTLVPNVPTETPQRKTIVLNTNDDLPNFVNDVSSKSESKHSNIYNDFDLSMSPVNKVEIVPKRKTILDNTGNISITQALPSKIIPGVAEKRRTMVFGEEEANVSVTQALPAKILSGPSDKRRTTVYDEEGMDISMTQALPSKIINGPERRHTMVYNEEEGNISITQALPSNIIGASKRQTMVHDIDEEVNITTTKGLPSIIKTGPAERRRTIVYDQEDGNISMTQVLPSNIISDMAERRRTTVHDDTNISMTQALPSIIKGASERHRSIAYDQEDGYISKTPILPSNIISDVAERRRTTIHDTNISMTQALPSNIIKGATERHRSIAYDQEVGSISKTPVLPSNIISDVAERRRATVHDVDADINISITQALPTNIINGAVERRRTVVYGQEDGNISMTQVLPSNIISEVADRRRTTALDVDDGINISMKANINGATERRRTIVYDQEDGNISTTQVLPSNIINDVAERRRTTGHDVDKDINISVKQALPSEIINDATERRRTVVYDQEDGNVSMTEILPTNIISDAIEKRITIHYTDEDEPKVLPSNIINDAEEKHRTMVYDPDEANISITQVLPSNIISAVAGKRLTIVYNDDEDANISMTEVLPSNIIGAVKRQTIVFEDANISITQTLPTKMINSTAEKNQTLHVHDENDPCLTSTSPVLIENVQPNERQQSVLYENDSGNISISETVPAGILQTDTQDYNEKRKTVAFDSSNGNISMTKAVHNKSMEKQNVSPKQKSIVIENAAANISIKQILPVYVALNADRDQKNRTVEYEEATAEASIKQAASPNLNASRRPETPEMRRTIVYEDDTGNISVNQTLPRNIIDKEDSEEKRIEASTANITLKNSDTQKRRTVVFENDTSNISVNQSLPLSAIDKIDSEEKQIETFIANISLTDTDTNKRRTIVFEDDTGNISGTAIVPSEVLPGIVNKSTVDTTNDEIATKTSNDDTPVKRNTTIHGDNLDISAPQAVYASIIEPTKQDDKSIHNNGDVPLVKSAPGVAFLLSGVESHSNIKLEDFIEPPKTEPMDADDEEYEMPITETSPKVEYVQESIQHNSLVPEKDTNTSATRPIPTDLMSIQGAVMTNLVNKQPAFVPNQDLILYPSVVTSDTEPKVTASEEKSVNNESINSVNESVNKDIESMNKDNESNITSTSKVYDTDVAEYLSTKACSEDPSLCLQESAGQMIKSKLELCNLKENVDMDVDGQLDLRSISLDSSDRASRKMSLMNALLDMSDLNSKRQSGKVVDVSAETLSQNEPKPNPTSNDSLFYIIREEDANIQTDILNSDKQVGISEQESYVHPKEGDKPPAIEYKILDSPLDKKLHKLTPEKKDKNKSPGKQNVADSEVGITSENDSHKSLRKSFRNANDTKELLDMISDFTDKTRCEIEDEAPQSHTKESAPPENKTEPLRRSFAQKRQSIAFSREDLLNNISMAQAALQKSRLELDDSAVDDTQDTFAEESISPPKTDRMSSEVVKTLHFDDESMSGCSVKSDGSKQSPLRKTAFGETSYMKESSKGNVIPTYLKDVSEGIKELMSDLVKPMADVLPFDSTTDRHPKKTVSTISTQIQANLVTSSQIDMDSDLSSNPISTCMMENASSFCLRNHILKAPSDSEKLLTSESEEIPTDLSETWHFQPKCVPEQAVPGQVLIFDHLNPLNNILLGPLDYANAHAYNPVKLPMIETHPKSEETLCGSERSAACQANAEFITKESDVLSDKITTMYHVNTSPRGKRRGESPEKLVDSSGGKPKDIPEKQSAAIDTIEAKIAEVNNSILKNAEAYNSILKKADANHSILKNAEVNTVIAMKENKELLNASSSLTLVDEAMLEPEDTSKSPSKDLETKDKPSPMRVVYKLEEHDGIAVMEKIAPTPTEKDEQQVKCKKRNYKPSCLMTAVLPNVDITPKPKSKIQKLSNSPDSKYGEINQTTPKITPERDVETHERILTYEKVDLKPRTKENLGTTLTVQQVITEFHVETGLNKSLLSKQVSEAIKSDYSTTNPNSCDEMEINSLDDVSSFTSSKNLHAVKREESVSTDMSGLKSTVPSDQSSKSGWHPDVKSMSSSASDFDAGVNIVAKIDMLPFMGSHECEWESSTADTWCFRLLHGRIRLTVRLAHSHANAIKTRVRADTPVNDITVETIQHEKKNPVSSLCVRFACETMRYMVARARGAGGGAGGGAEGGGGGAALARGVPALLRRCAATARVALRWGRAMHDAKLQLAYTLNNDGYLTLKVANIPLRSVWEVSMRLELVVEWGAAAPWPRASDVRVTRVVSDVRLCDSDVRRALAATPRDWGHAPRTVWRIFRYLKNKTRDDDILLGA